MKRIFLFFLFSILILNGFSQNERGKNEPLEPGTIRGRVVDAQTGEPIEFATASLQSYSNPALVSGAVSNEKGIYTITNVKEGKYRLDIKFLGYEHFVIDSVLITAGNGFKAGTVKLKQAGTELKQVTIEEQQAAFRTSIDKKVFDVDKNIMSQGQSASEVLKNVPSVDVDIDGNISLRGSGNVTVLIDGKPSGLTGSSRRAILEQLPASSIQSIELITNPSAKYDPDGMSGIINIVMKKNEMQGANGSVSVSAGTRNKYNGSVSVNYRNKKLNAFGTYSYKNNQRYNYGSTWRKNFFSDTTFYYDQDNKSTKYSSGHTAKVGLDYSFNDRNSIGISSSLNTNQSPSSESIQYNLLDENSELSNMYYRFNDQLDKEISNDVSLNYNRRFAREGRSFSVELSSSGSKSNSDNSYRQQDYNTDGSIASTSPLLQNTYSHTTFSVYTGKMDYSTPLTGKSRLETGLKVTDRSNDRDFLSEDYSYNADAWVNNTGLSNHFIYREQVYAGYATYANGFKKFTWQLGLRAEQAYTRSTLVNTGTTYTSNYFNIYPSLHLNQKVNDKNELQLSYSRRVNRPGLNSLNPFAEYTDPLNLRYGNPYLKPEYIDSYELSSISYLKRKMSLNSTLYYRQINNVIQRVKDVQPSGLSTITSINLNTAVSYGVELIAKNDFFKWWNMTTNFNFYENRINGSNVDADLNNNAVTWFAKVMSNFTILKSFQLQVSGNYQAPMPLPQGTMRENYSVDLGARKDLFKGKATLSLSVTDVFNTQRMSMLTYGNNFEQDFMRKRESRVGTVSFVYRVGKADVQKKKGGRQPSPQDNMNDMRGGEDGF